MAQRPLRIRWRWMELAVVAALPWTAPQVRGQTQTGRNPIQISDLRQLENAFTSLAERVRPSTVTVRTFSLGPYIDPGKEGAAYGRMRWPRTHGSGAVIGRDGQILTSTHVIEGADEIIVVLHDGREFEGVVVQADRRSDLAVIKIDVPHAPPVRLGRFERVKPGQWCFAVGNPFGLANRDGRTAFTYGIVSATGKNLTDELNADATGADERYYGNLIQTSAAINPGNSGGPLFNIDGEMIGLVAAIESRSGVTEGVGFAIPMDRRILGTIDTLKQGQVVRYGFLGVQVADPSAAERKASGRGTVIRAINPPDGPAGKAGLRAGDLIVEFNGLPIQNTDHLIRTIGAASVGTEARIVYLRDGRRRTATTALAARDVSPVLVGSRGAIDEEPRTSRWRGAWLAEPTGTILREFGLTREQAGLVIMAVDADSDAARAGLEPQQIILKFDRRPVHTIEQFLAADERAGPRIRLEISAEGQTKTVRMPTQDRSM